MAAQHRRGSRPERATEDPQRTGRHHLILVPGFGGFDALGSLRYYHGVTDVLRELGPGSELSVSYFPNLPTASVQTRARQLQFWLSEMWKRAAILPQDHLHLIGHSTGGLDIRQLLSDYRQQWELHRQGVGEAWPPVLDRIASVQFLSTPHRGTMLAHHLSRTWVRRTATQVLLRLCYRSLWALGEQGTGQFGRLGKRVAPSAKAPDWIDAIIDTLTGPAVARGNLQRAHARSAYFSLQRWLLDMASDFNAITDLDSSKPPGAPISPAHQDATDFEPDVRFIQDREIHVRSIVTVATPPPPGVPKTLYSAAYALTAYRPSPRLLPKVVHELFGSANRRLEPADNDGFVNSVSQVWPDEESSVLVDGDHADVIGHFRSPSAQREPDFFAFRQYDLLSSQTGFHEETFDALWRSVGAYALEHAAAGPALPVRARAAEAEARTRERYMETAGGVEGP